MSDFLHRLITRHQDQTNTIQPYIPPRFAAEPAPIPAPFWNEHSTSSFTDPAFTSESQPSISVFHLPPSSPTLPILASPPASPSPLESLTRWVHQVIPAAASPVKPPHQHQASHLLSPPSPMPPPKDNDFFEEIHGSMEGSLSASPLSRPLNPPSNLSPDPTSTQNSTESSPPSPVFQPSAPASQPPSPPRFPLSSPPERHPLQPASASIPRPQLLAPTIKVAISRLEIRATPPATSQAPAPPKPRTSLRRPALSLDAYLQQRSRGV